MCGLAGFFRPSGLSRIHAEQSLIDMSDRIKHRGPDDSGIWLDGDAGIALGHRRLSVIDLTSAGHQPMMSASGRYVLSFNGEIYNHQVMREELEVSGTHPDWRGRSDTETLLAAFDRWGIATSLQKSVGMFAFALWDKQERTLTLARDRMGEKPLYYGWQGDTFLFGSELKALRAHPSFEADIDRNVLAMYLRRGYIEAPCSIYENIFKLRPGTYLQLSARDQLGKQPQPEVYWSLYEVAERGLAQPFTGDDKEAVDRLEGLLQDAVALQRVADVPLGAFLSGGVDSTTVVALMQARASRPVKTFTIGFHEAPYNEARNAKLVAEHLGTDHTELYVTSREAMDVIPNLPQLYDEPFGDSSAIPTCLVAQMARQEVTVSLSGDGGDELFAGYTRFQRTDDIWRAVRRVPNLARKSLASGVGAVSRLAGASQLSRRANRAARYLSAESLEECYQQQILQRQDVSDLVFGAGESPLRNPLPEFMSLSDTCYQSMLYIDSVSYLPDDILAKIDRAAMAVSLETRVPLLDHRVVEFSWRLPMKMKIRDGQSKWLLKQVMHRFVPATLMDRPKSGFGVPVSDWIRGPLRDWAEDLLSEDRLKREGFLDPKLVRQGWQRHLDRPSAGDETHWQLLAFQAWHESAANL